MAKIEIDSLFWWAFQLCSLLAGWALARRFQPSWRFGWGDRTSLVTQIKRMIYEKGRINRRLQKKREKWKREDEAKARAAAVPSILDDINVHLKASMDLEAKGEITKSHAEIECVRELINERSRVLWREFEDLRDLGRYEDALDRIRIIKELGPFFLNNSNSGEPPEDIEQTIRSKIRRPPGSPYSSEPKLVIEGPKLGMLNLQGAAAAPIAAEDSALLGSLFDETRQSAEGSPRCDVLFIYCEIDAQGRPKGSPIGLREIIRDSRASVVVVASENAQPCYSAALVQRGYGSANLVLTFERGKAFAQFFQNLFAKMRDGMSMPLAWVSLAPQVPDLELDPDAPKLIFLCERGPICFRR